MRENTKWIMMVTAFAFVGLMFFQWGMDITGQSSTGLGEIGRVNGAPVLYDSYIATYRNLYDQVQAAQPEPISTSQNTQIEDAAFDEVVNQILIQQELRRRGILVTDDEIQAAARFSPPPSYRSNPAFETEGRFDLQKYQQFISSPTVDETLLLQLEAYYRDVIPRGKLLRQLGEGLYLSDQELWSSWKDFNEEVIIRYIPLNPATRVADEDVEISETEIESYYRRNQEDFATPAIAQVKVAVIPKAPTVADTAAALQKATDLRQEILDGTSFAEVADREVLEGAPVNGGELGWLQQGDMIVQLDSVAFSARVGRISEPIRTANGFHLLEVTEREADSAQARQILVPILRTDESEIVLLTLADSLEALSENMPLDEAAEELGIEVTSVDLNESFPFAPGAGQTLEGADWAFEEGLDGDVSPVYENRQAFYAFELVSSQLAGYLTLQEARPSIEQTIRMEKKLAAVVSEGITYVEALRGGQSMDQLAVDNNLEIRVTDPFSRTTFVPGIGQQNEAIGTAFGLDGGEYSDVIQAGNNAYILQLVQHMAPDSAAWDLQKEDQRAQLMASLEQGRLGGWIEGLRALARIIDRREEVLQPADGELPQNPFFGF